MRIVGVTKRDFGRSLFVAATGDGRDRVVTGCGTGTTLCGVSKQNEDEFTAAEIGLVGVICDWWNVLNIETNEFLLVHLIDVFVT